MYARPSPNLRAYDPAFAYELAAIIADGICRMYEKGEDVLYYLTVGNQNYAMPPKPEGNDVDEGIIKGLYCFSKEGIQSRKKAHLLGSGALMTEVLKAKTILETDHKVATSVWSVTSYKALYDEALHCERLQNALPQMKQKSHVEQCLSGQKGVVVSVCDYVKALPHCIAPYIKQPFAVLGTDGFGLSESRDKLRDHFGVSAKHIVEAVLKLM